MQWDFVVIVHGGGGGGAVPRRNIGELCRDGDGTRAPPPRPLQNFERRRRCKLAHISASSHSGSGRAITPPHANGCATNLRRVFFLLPIAGHVSADFNGLQLDDGST